jgi:hypothetical protein
MRASVACCCAAILALAVPASALAYVPLHGQAKVVVVRDGFQHGIGGPEHTPPRTVILNCFSATRSTANANWAYFTNLNSTARSRKCQRWEANGWTIARYDRQKRYWVPDTAGDEVARNCRIRGENGQPNVPVNVARDFFGPRCRSYPRQ